MKYIITLLLLSMNLWGLRASDTSTLSTNTTLSTKSALVTTNDDKGIPVEFTLGGAGFTNPKTGNTQFGAQFTLAAQPLVIPVWFGVAQEISWEPDWAAATDLYSDWAFDLIKDKLALNVGWSVGGVYDKDTLGWRTGPEVSLEYYTKGNAFLFVGANYDLLTRASSTGWVVAGENAVRFSFGIGVAF